MYPLAGLRPQLLAIIAELRATMPDLVSVLVEHRPRAAAGLVARRGAPQPGAATGRRCCERFSVWEADPSRMALAPPTVAFAVLGQARASGRLSPERESALLRRLIGAWAVRSSLETARATTRSDDRDVRRPAHDLGRLTRLDRPHAAGPSCPRRNLTGGTTCRTATNAQGPAGSSDFHIAAQPHRITAGGIVLLTAELPS